MQVGYLVVFGLFFGAIARFRGGLVAEKPPHVAKSIDTAGRCTAPDRFIRPARMPGVPNGLH